MESLMLQNVFADAVAEVSVGAGVVRVVFGVQRKGPKDERPELVPTITLNLPIDGFANSVPVLQGLIDKMVKDGVLKLRDPKQSGSPNFN
jgi:hypothetical protein